MNRTEPASSVDAYIASFSEDVQKILRKIRATVLSAAPTAEETIKYAMPTLVLHGNLVYYAAFKNHIGFYGLPKGDEDFQNELAKYKTGKGSIQFPLDKPIPYDLISQIVTFRVAQQQLEHNAKLAKKKT